MLDRFRWHAGIAFIMAVFLGVLEQVPNVLLGKVADWMLVLGMLGLAGLVFGFGYLLGYFKLPKSWKTLLVGLILMIALTLLGNWLLSWAGHSTTLNQESLKALKGHGLYLFVLSVIFAPIIEEVIFRGLLLAQVSLASLFISGLLFTVLHVPTSIGALVIYGGMAIIFMGLRLKTGSLEYGLILHVLNNLVGVLLLLFFS